MAVAFTAMLHSHVAISVVWGGGTSLLSYTLAFVQIEIELNNNKTSTPPEHHDQQRAQTKERATFKYERESAKFIRPKAIDKFCYDKTIFD